MKSFLTGQRALATESLRPLAAQVAHEVQFGGLRVPQFSRLAPSASGAQVEVVKEGDKVVRLVVTCSCGEQVEIDCLYAGGR
ncbi:MAG: hypothetical protein JNL39_15445 [Opitutaceae bacterium]|nr:hypothetical protein [Opitutaceae bacterium]